MSITHSFIQVFRILLIAGVSRLLDAMRLEIKTVTPKPMQRPNNVHKVNILATREHPIKINNRTTVYA